MNELLGALILTTSISAQSAGAGDAVKALIKASYKQADIDKHVKTLEKKHVPKELKTWGGYTVMVARIVTEGKISYEWRF
jgi:hypothetical protein